MNLKNTTRTLLSLLAIISLSIGAAHADDLVVSATSQTSDDYALAVAWSNQLATSDSEHQLTVVDNGSVNRLRQLAAGRLDIAVIGAPRYLDAVNKGGNFSKDPERLTESYKDLRSLSVLLAR